MEFIFEFFQQFTDPDWIIRNGGLYLVLIIIFIETGLFFGFFLPGDPLLFVSGMVIALSDSVFHPFTNDIINLIFWQFLFLSSAVLGNFLGYWFGKRFSRRLLRNNKDYWLLKRKHIKSAQDFYEKRGGFAVTIARFIPIARTFVPIIGGAVNMNLKKFVFFNLIGALIWVVSLTTLGYLLGENPWVNRNLEWTLLGIVGIATLPVILKMLLPEKK